MISLLSKLFIKDKDNFQNQTVRQKYGVLCGAVGIFLNIVLFAFKLVASAISGSVSIAADAFNNLSDAGSSLVTMIGFKLSGQRADSDHPFGHGRIEYISGFIVSMLIILMGFELGKSSVAKITGGSAVEFSVISAVILSFAIAVKVYMYFYNRSIAKKIDSAAMRATASDSLSDCISTGLVLLCTVLSAFSSFNFDGWCGCFVALFILYSGIKSAKDTIDLLLGTPPSEEFVSSISDIVMAHDEVSGIHDLVVHNYGPGRMMISLHAEVSQDEDILKIHDTIDNIEQELSSALGCEAVIHMDPIATNDETVVQTRAKVSELAKALDPSITIHDFRMVIGHTHTNVIFDMVVPFNFRLSEAEIKEEMTRLVKIISPDYFAVIKIDKMYSA